MNRHQRRAASSKRGEANGALQGLAGVSAQLGEALKAVEDAGGLRHITATLEACQRELADVQKVMGALLDDVQALADQVEACQREQAIQRAVTLELFTRLASMGLVGEDRRLMAANMRQMEERLRSETSVRLQTEAEESSCEVD